MSKESENSFKRKRESTSVESRARIPAEDLPAHINYWLNEARPDCYFKVGPECGPTERIGALKVFLSAHSEPLRAMFETKFREQERSEVRIVDVEPATFKTLLKCVCGGSDIVIPKLSFQESAKLLQITDKYLVDFVKNKVLRNLGELLTCQNVFTALLYPVCLQDDVLNASVVSIVRRHTREILLDSRFLELTTEALVWLLQQKDLSAQEIDIWHAIIKWAKYKANSNDGSMLRDLLFPLLGHIRFLSMDFKTLWKYVVPSNVLLMVEVYEICKSLSTGTVHEMSHICKVMCARQMPVSSDKITIIPMTFTKHADVFCAINNCRELARQEDSESFSWSRLQWKIRAGRKSEAGYDSFGLFISCNGEVERYACPFKATATLISDDGCRRNSRSFSGNFTEKITLIGNSNFCSWETMTRIFVKNNRVKVVFNIQLL